jgi:hypothetical protein
VRVKDIGSDPLEETWCGLLDAKPAWRQVRRTARSRASVACLPELRMNRSGHRTGRAHGCAHLPPWRPGGLPFPSNEAKA